MLNSKIILSKCKDNQDVVEFFENNKFYVGHDAGSYTITDESDMLYIESDSKDFFYTKKDKLVFTTNKFIEYGEANLFTCQNAKNDAIQREKYFKNIETNEANFSKVHDILSSHDAHVCAHSARSTRYTTCTTIIDKRNLKFYFSKQLPCKLKNESDYFQVNLDFK